MPAVNIDKHRQLKAILEKLDPLPAYNWLVSNIECYDTEDWDGGKKWEEEWLFLSDEELRRDIELHDPWFVWGCFSAIPCCYAKEEILASPAPTLETPYYMSNVLLPQHPLAILEIAVFDGCYMNVSSHDPAMLQPLYSLPFTVIDEEASNRLLNTQLCRIRDTLYSFAPNISDEIANEVQWICYHKFFQNTTSEISQAKLEMSVQKCYKTVTSFGYALRHRYSKWNPYLQK